MNMDTETRAALGRIDRYFELIQAQYVELRRDVNSCLEQISDLRRDVTELRHDVNSCLEQIAAHRRETSAGFEELGVFRRDVTARLDALERR
jgi:cell division septum initiation protein DivIVA